MRRGPHFYDRAGEPIGFWRFLRLWPGRRVASDEVEVRGNWVVVSTVWLGVGPGGTSPQIFETTVIGRCELSDVRRRYSTEDQALAGHEVMRQRVAALDRLPDDEEKEDLW